MDELKDAAESLKRTYQGEKEELANTIHNPQITDPEALHDGVTPAEAATRASAPAAAPKPAAEPEAVAPWRRSRLKRRRKPRRHLSNLLRIKPQRLTNLVAIVNTWLLKIPNPLSVI